MATPQYQLTQPFYVDDNFIPEEMIIDYDGVPNESMVPLNDEAKTKMQGFLATLAGGKTPALGDAVYAAVAARPREPVTVFVPQREVPLTGTVAPEGMKAPAKPKAVASIAAAPKDPAQRPIRVMGNVQSDPINSGVD